MCFIITFQHSIRVVCQECYLQRNHLYFILFHFASIALWENLYRIFEKDDILIVNLRNDIENGVCSDVKICVLN